MRKLLLLLLSANIYAQPCTIEQGEIKLQVYSNNKNVEVYYSILFADPYYPQSDLFNITYTACFDTICNKTTETWINPPQGFNESARFILKPQCAGDHNFSYEISVPRYGCEVRESIVI